MRQLKLLCLGIVAALGYTAPALGSDTAFFIDTPTLLRIASEAAYQKYPEIPPGGLVTRNQSISLNCNPERYWIYTDVSNPQCLVQEREPSNCSAHIKFLIRSSIKQDVTALSDGMCRTNMEYTSVTVRVYENGWTYVSQGSGNSGGTNLCDSPERIYEIKDVIQLFEKGPTKDLAKNP